MLDDQTFVSALHNTFAATIQGYTNQPPVALHFLQQNIDYQNHKSTDILTKMLEK